MDYLRKQYGQFKKYNEHFPNAEDRVLKIPNDMVGVLSEEKNFGSTKLGSFLDKGDWKIEGLPRKSDEYKKIIDGLIDFVYHVNL